MMKCLLIAALLGETVPLIFMYLYRYVNTLEGMNVFGTIQMLLCPSSILGMALGGGDQPADEQNRGVAILLNAALYTLVGLFWFLFLRRRPET